MAMMILLMIRSLFWHRPSDETGPEGAFRVDGRTKCSQISKIFGISRRAVTDARAKLIELGWLIPLDAPQWQVNKWGQRYQINVDAFGPETAQTVEKTEGNGEQDPEGSHEVAGGFASPCLNQITPSSTKNEPLNTRSSAPRRPEPAGVSRKTIQGKEKRKAGSRKMKGQGGESKPNLKNMVADDLRQTDRLLELYSQAIDQKWAEGSEAGRLAFIALAERARALGENPPKLFAWLLRKQRFEFITHTDEERAAARLREWYYGPREQEQWGG